MLKYCILAIFWQFTKSLNQYLYLSKENENMETCIFAWFEQLKEFTQFSDTFAG